MTFEQLTDQASLQNITLGWDAVLAINATQLTQFCFEQYVQAGPDTAYSTLQTILEENSSIFWALDLLLGPPLISFPSANISGVGPQCILTINVLQGSLTSFNSDTMEIISVINMEADQNILMGTITLNKVSGTEDQLGNVYLNLGSGSYNVQLQGIDPNSILSTQLATVIQAYFNDNKVTYLLGTLIVDESTSSALQPSDFELFTQPNTENKEDGCLLIFIRTTSTNTSLQPGTLPVYPIPDNYTSSLLIANEVVFNQLLVSGNTKQGDSLEDHFATFGTVFTGIVELGSYFQTIGLGGIVTLSPISGRVSLTQTIDSVASDNEGQNASSVYLPMDGFMISPGGLNFAVSWNQLFSQWWQQTTISHPAIGYQLEDIEGTLSWLQSISLTVDSGNNINFNVENPSVIYKPQQFSSWQKFLGSFNLTGNIQNNVTNALQSVMAGYTLPSIGTFSLLNLLFPSSALITLQVASIPCDLLAVGNINTSLTVAPAQVALTSGQTQSFSIAQAGVSCVWQIAGDGMGTINEQGNYLAPDTVTTIGFDTIIATDTINAQEVGYAMVQLTPTVPGNYLPTSPSSITLSASQCCQLTTTDPGATWTMTGNTGKLSQGMGGSWIYTAPSILNETTSVTIIATDTNQQATGTTTVYLQQSELITIQSSDSTINVGQSVTLTASANNFDIYEFIWMIYPSGQGSIAPVPGNSSSAVYTAPADPINNNNLSISVIAYNTGGDGSGMGIGITIINVIDSLRNK